MEINKKYIVEKCTRCICKLKISKAIKLKSDLLTKQTLYQEYILFFQ